MVIRSDKRLDGLDQLFRRSLHTKFSRHVIVTPPSKASPNNISSLHHTRFACPPLAQQLLFARDSADQWNEAATLDISPCLLSGMTLELCCIKTTLNATKH